jgi:aminoglycoside 2'-N-acetyltransferase I
MVKDLATASDRPRLRRVSSPDLTEPEIANIRTLLAAAFGPDDDERFTDDDWAHAIGGLHFVLDLEDEIVAHASVVERELHIDGRPLRTGYVEAVGVTPDRQDAGFGSLVMAEVTAYIRECYEFGALGTGRHRFYERLGWRVWAGPTFVRTEDGLQRTPEEDGDILVLLTPASPSLDFTASLSCDWRPGDVW